MLARLTSPLVNDRGPVYASQALAAVHRGNRRRVPFSLLFATYAGELALFVDVCPKLAPMLTRQFQGCYQLQLDAAIKTDPMRGLFPFTHRSAPP